MSFEFDVEQLKKISWRAWGAACLGAVIIPLFIILVWQLATLNPEYYCNIVKAQGVPPGDNCFKLLAQGLQIKGWVIWLLIGTLAAFVLMVLAAIVRIGTAITGPGGLGINLQPKDDPNDQHP